jgi:hypothetical protein
MNKKGDLPFSKLAIFILVLVFLVAMLLLYAALSTKGDGLLGGLLKIF